MKYFRLEKPRKGKSQQSLGVCVCVDFRKASWLMQRHRRYDEQDKLRPVTESSRYQGKDLKFIWKVMVTW